MIARIKGKITEKEEHRIVLGVGGIYYEIYIPLTVYTYLKEINTEEAELIIYHYFSIEKNRGIPIMIGFMEKMEKDFFEKFISVSGIGPKVALKAFDKPVALIARAIEEGDLKFLNTLAGIGMQKAKQIVAHLQGKVGRFALIKGEEFGRETVKKEVVEEAKEILKRLQYSPKEIDDMIKKVMTVKPAVNSVEDLLNEIYRQQK